MTVPELMLLVLSAFFHDLGMAPEEKDILAWRKIWDREPEFEGEFEDRDYRSFSRFINSKPNLVQQLEVYKNEGNISKVDSVKDHLVSEYIRLTHATRARSILEKDWLGKIKYKDVDMTSELATICFSHNEDPLSVLELDKNFLCGSGVFACLPMVAVLLRLADILDFDAKRTPAVLFSHLHVTNPVSLGEWNKHRAVESWHISDKEVTYMAKCKHPAIESSIHEFCDLIDVELGACNNIIYEINSGLVGDRGFEIRLPFRVDRSQIQTAKNIHGNALYSYRETRFSLSKSQVISLLMGTKLYGDPEVALRELIQNSIDACLLREALESSWENQYIPKIEVSYRRVGETYILEVEDNGVGMDQSIIDKYYSNVGKSFYKSAEFHELKYETKAVFTPTSRFGIGILSCFMISDSIEVETRKVYGAHDSSKPLNLLIEGQESIFWVKEGDREKPGTTTKLQLRQNTNPWEDMSEVDFIKAVENTIPNPPFKIGVFN